MKKVENQKQAYEMFRLLGIKDVTTKRQLKNGTQVWELPIKQMYNTLNPKPLRFAIYESGYVRNVSDCNSSAYQINKTKKRPSGNGYHFESVERILIPEYKDQLIYLANFILKNYYSGKANLYQISDWTMGCLEDLRQKAINYDNLDDHLPFENEIQVIINGHRYNLT